MMTADEIIDLLQLRPHPEGGYFRETFRDASCDSTGRSRSTAIYFLLKKGERSHWHRVDATETWHWYGGGALELMIAPGKVIDHGDAGGTSPVTTLRLGGDLANAEQPQAVVPCGWWQQARSLGDYTLVGCTVAPGFEFSGFELADPGFDPTNS